MQSNGQEFYEKIFCSPEAKAVYLKAWIWFMRIYRISSAGFLKFMYYTLIYILTGIRMLLAGMLDLIDPYCVDLTLPATKYNGSYMDRENDVEQEDAIDKAIKQLFPKDSHLSLENISTYLIKNNFFDVDNKVIKLGNINNMAARYFPCRGIDHFRFDLKLPKNGNWKDYESQSFLPGIKQSAFYFIDNMWRVKIKKKVENSVKVEANLDAVDKTQLHKRELSRALLQEISTILNVHKIRLSDDASIRVMQLCSFSNGGNNKKPFFKEKLNLRDEPENVYWISIKEEDFFVCIAMCECITVIKITH